ncbi:MAG TPA: hypothetical protein VMV27_10790 [Candidatus Binataceae bacterium]|nr:hypothetical protein [Candidatus Binataceae bacterium]
MTVSIRGNVVWSYVNFVVGFAAPLILIPIYVRCLGSELYGQWLVIVGIGSYLGIVGLGSWQAIGNRIAEASARRQSAEISRIVSTSFWFYVVLAFTVIASAAILTPALAARLAPRASTRATAACALFVAFTAAAYPLRLYATLLRGIERVDREQAIAAVANIARVAGLAAVMLAGQKLVAISIVQGAVGLGGGIAATVIALRLFPQGRPLLRRCSFSVVRDLAKPSLGFLGLSIGSSLVFGADNLVIGYALGGSAVTRYAVPMRLALIATSVFSVGTTALWPTLTARFTRGDRATVSDGFVAVSRLSVIYALCATSLFFFAGPAFLRLWVGPTVFPGRPTFAWQAALLFMSVLLIPADAVLMATTHHYGYAALAMVEAALNLALSLWWVRHFGTAGVVAATVTARLVTNGWYLPAAALRAIGMSGREFTRAIAHPGWGSIAHESA